MTTDVASPGTDTLHVDVPSTDTPIAAADLVVVCRSCCCTASAAPSTGGIRSSSTV